METHERILVPLDGSGCGETIIPRVEELAAEKNEGICLLRVVSARTFPGVDPTDGPSESRARGGGISSRSCRVASGPEDLT